MAISPIELARREQQKEETDRQIAEIEDWLKRNPATDKAGIRAHQKAAQLIENLLNKVPNHTDREILY